MLRQLINFRNYLYMAGAFLAAGLLLAGDSTTPNPHFPPSRYHLHSARLGIAPNAEIPVILRIDSTTGKTFELVALKNSTLVWRAVREEETSAK